MRHDLEGWERRGKSQARDAAVGGLGKACGCMQGEHLHLASAGLCEGRSSQVDDGPKGFAMDVRIDDDPPHVINFRHCQQSREGGENRGGGRRSRGEGKDSKCVSEQVGGMGGGGVAVAVAQQCDSGGGNATSRSYSSPGKWCTQHPPLPYASKASAVSRSRISSLQSVIDV